MLTILGPIHQFNICQPLHVMYGQSFSMQFSMQLIKRYEEPIAPFNSKTRLLLLLPDDTLLHLFLPFK